MSFQKNQSKKIKLNHIGICISNDQCASRHVQADSPHQHYNDNKTMSYREFEDLMNQKLQEYSDSQLTEQQLASLEQTSDRLNKFCFYQKHLNSHHQSFKTLINENDLQKVDKFDDDLINRLLTLSKYVDYQRNQEILTQVYQFLNIMSVAPVKSAEDQVDFYIPAQEDPQEDPKKDQPSNNQTTENEPLNEPSHEDSIHISLEEGTFKQEDAQDIVEIIEQPPKIAQKATNLQTIKKNIQKKKENKKLMQIQSEQEAHTPRQTRAKKQVKQTLQAPSMPLNESDKQTITIDQSIQQIYKFIEEKQIKKMYDFWSNHKFEFRVPPGPIEKVEIDNAIIFKSGNLYYGYSIAQKALQWVGYFEGPNLIYGQLIIEEVYVDKRRVYKIIEGQFQNGLAQNNVRIFTSEHESYEGAVVNNKMHGEGVYRGYLHTDEGLRTNYMYEYRGEFVENNFCGYGVQISDNFEYRGQFMNSYFNGSGEFINKATGEVYEGKFLNQNYDGQGKLTLEGHYRYKGEFKDNQFHGKGKFTRQQPGMNKDELFWNVKSYRGSFSKHQRHGEGEEVLFNGNKFKGQFKNDARVVAKK